jgi:spore germination protein YaaH
MKKSVKLILIISISCLIIGTTISTTLYFYYTPFYNVPYPEKERFFWYAVWNDLSLNRLYESYEEITMISPVWWNVFENGTIQENVLTWMNESDLLELVAFCEDHNIEIHPLVSNYSEEFSAELISEIINNQTRITNFISSANYFLDYYNCTGINLDFEGVPAEDRVVFTTFLERVRAEINESYFISIDVPAKSWDTTIGWSGAFDYEEIGQICDYIMIMTYDYHYSGSNPGEIAPRTWVRRTLKYACNVIPYEKIFCGIPLYGYNWPNNDYQVISAEYSYFTSLAAQYNVEPKRYRDSKELYFSYIDDESVEWTAVYPDAFTTFEKEKEINKFPIGGYCYWYMGLEDPEYWL